MIKFWETLDCKLAEQWVVNLLTPAFVFWIGGIGAWTYYVGSSRLKDTLTRFAQLPELAQVALVIGALLLVITSSVVVQRFELEALRALEGYWPRWMRPLRRWRIAKHAASITQKQARFQALSGQGFHNMTPDEREDYAALDWILMRVPADATQRMPTPTR